MNEKLVPTGTADKPRWRPKRQVSYLITIADGVTDGQLKLDVGLFELVGVRLQPDRRLFVGASVALEVGVEERVHEGGLAEPGLSDAHDVEGEAILNGLVDQLQGHQERTF